MDADKIQITTALIVSVDSYFLKKLALSYNLSLTMMLNQIRAGLIFMPNSEYKNYMLEIAELEA